MPIGAQPALLHLPWRAAHTVLDVLYAPWPTPLAQRVAEAGGTVISGLEVLFWQATAQVELMTGQPAPIAAMRAPSTPADLPFLLAAAGLVAGPWPAVAAPLPLP